MLGRRLGFGRRAVCLGIIDMGIGSQEAMAAMAARAASPSIIHFEASEASPCVRATAGSSQELEFGARSAPEILVIIYYTPYASYQHPVQQRKSE